MKKLRFVASALVVAALLFGLVSCKFNANSNQLMLYYSFISDLKEACASKEIIADEIKAGVKLTNTKLSEEAETKGCKIVDKQAGTAVKKGTTEKELLKRFVLKKA